MLRGMDWWTFEGADSSVASTWFGLRHAKLKSCSPSTYSGFESGCFVFEVWVLRFRVLGAPFSRFGCFVFEIWVLRFRVLGAPFSSLGFFVFEIWVLRASVFVYECFRFRNYQSFNTINHWSKTFLIDNIYVLIGEKKSDFKKKCSIFAGLSIKKLKPSSCILAEKGQKMRYFKTIKPIKIARSKEVGAWN